MIFCMAAYDGEGVLLIVLSLSQMSMIIDESSLRGEVVVVTDISSRPAKRGTIY